MIKYEFQYGLIFFLQLNHTQNNLAQFYKLDEAVCKNVFTHGGLPTSFVKQTQTFTETCVMVREPALEIIDLIKKSDLSKPVNRFVLCILLQIR